jgi:hypothetical protein
MWAARRLLVGFVVIALVAVACGGDDADDASREPTSDGGGAGQTDGGDDDDDAASAGFGEALEATIELSGAVDEAYTPGPGTSFRFGGGCQEGVFGVHMQVNDTALEQTIASVLVSIDEDLSGGETGTYDADLQVELFEPGDLSQRQEFRGSGTIEVTRHDAPDDLNARRMDFVVAGDGLERSDGLESDGALAVDADVRWVMGCP